MKRIFFIIICFVCCIFLNCDIVLALAPENKAGFYGKAMNDFRKILKSKNSKKKLKMDDTSLLDLPIELVIELMAYMPLEELLDLILTNKYSN